MTAEATEAIGVSSRASSDVLFADAAPAGSMPAAEIMARARVAATTPYPRLSPTALAEHQRRFADATPRSAQLFARGRQVLARGTQHVDQLTAPYPIYAERGSGSILTDVDGNSYVDMILAGGAISLGHSNRRLNDAIRELLVTRTGFHGNLDEYELLAAERICEIFPSAQSVRFVASGAEANLAAVRMARAHTGRRRIVKFRGHYHGWGDQFMVDLEVPGSGEYMAGGVPPEHYANTVLVHPHRPRELVDALATGEVAAVLSEPFGGESGLVPMPDGFHRWAKDLATEHGALYLLDEVVTGTRAGIGGAQRALGVTPDLFTLGKGLMNGFPSCGAVAGRKDVIDAASTGLPDGGPFAYIGGTMSGNVLSAAAAYHTLGILTEPGALDGAIAVTASLVTGLNELFDKAGVPFFAYHFGTILRIELTAPHAVGLDSMEGLTETIERRSVLSDYMIPVANSGVLSRMGRDMVSLAHTHGDNDKVVNAYAALIDCFE